MNYFQSVIRISLRPDLLQKLLPSYNHLNKIVYIKQLSNNSPKNQHMQLVIQHLSEFLTLTYVSQDSYTLQLFIILLYL